MWRNGWDTWLDQLPRSQQTPDRHTLGNFDKAVEPV